ncbi:MAG: hypothetical protein AAGL92_08150 [Pseudomonadota bacterium]
MTLAYGCNSLLEELSEPNGEWVTKNSERQDFRPRQFKVAVNPKLRKTIALIVQLLVKKDYASIESITNGNWLSAIEIANGVEEYGRSVATPPEDSYEFIDAVQIEGEVPSAWSVRFHLWTEEEGQSDLSIAMTLTDKNSDFMNVEFDGILVL